ncbi:hypothetical protein GQ457_08G035540 [Hibiscus cannabinus]
MSRNRGNRFGRSERGIGSSREIASVGKARRQGGSKITFVQIPYQWYRYSNPTLEFGYRYLLERVSVPLEMPRYRYLRKGIDTSLVIHQVSVLGEGYRYPSSPLGLEYRYWLPSTDTSCLKTVFGTP